MPLSVSQRFIPLASLHDVIINEGLRGWDVRYYLAAVKETPGSETRLDVAYQVNFFTLIEALLHVLKPARPEHTTILPSALRGVSWRS